MERPDRLDSLFDTGEHAEHRAVFRDKFEREPFLFRHRLCEDSRFEFDCIGALARRLPHKISFNGALPVTRGFRQPTTKKLSFEETFDRLESDQGWIILKKVQQDPDYAPLLRKCLEEVEELVFRPLEPLIESRTMSLIISSPGQVTPYHIDADCNFLFQLRGQKTLYVFDGRDRFVLPEQEEERFWAGELNAAQYREHAQTRAWSFFLKPGNGVHVPVIFPHWAKTGNEISVGLSINFRFHGRLRGDVYRMNHIMRRIGLRPRAVGESRLADFLKVIVLSPPREGLLMAHRMWQRFL